jgi:transcriptional regulator with XRE-family HTH domain
MSQEKLAKLLGLTFQQIQKYEKGVNRIGAGRLFDLARILDVGILYFYDGLIDESSGRPGFAEDEAPAPIPPPQSAEVAQLLAAFARIHDPKVRRRILDLVKSLAGGSG